MNQRFDVILRDILQAASLVLASLSVTLATYDTVSPAPKLSVALAVVGCLTAYMILMRRELRQSGHYGGVGRALFWLSMPLCGWLVYVAFRRYFSA